MKKIIFITLMLLTFHKMKGSDTLYYPVLRKSIDIALSNYNTENYIQLAHCSERIIQVYEDDWLPYYYGAYAYANMSFMENDDSNKEAYCDKAQELLDHAMKLRPEEAELYVVQALVYFARMAISPMINGPLYIPKANKALSDAEKFDPENPRVYYLKGKSTISTPKFFGGGRDVALPILEKALLMFNRYRPACNVAPYWGKEDAERLLNECKSDSIKAEK
jgi:hypothetical protein